MTRIARYALLAAALALSATWAGAQERAAL
jgi:hypothetical protein